MYRSQFQDVFILTISILDPSTFARSPVNDQSPDQFLQSIVEFEIVDVAGASQIDLANDVWFRSILFE